MGDTVKSFQELTPELYELAGGKGAMLSRMYQDGYPVPPGLVVLPSAFMDGEKLKDEAWNEIKAQINGIRKAHKRAEFAVRSSALSEDSSQASFAGEFETVLNLKADEEISSAIDTVAASANSERVQAYTKAQNVSGKHQVAVVIQLMVKPHLSGVLFTVNPVSGSPGEMTGNYVHGLGEQLVSGEANAQDFSFFRPAGKYSGPQEFKAYAKKLYKLALRLEKSLDIPQDIEWAVADEKLYILQARPVTTLSAGRIERYEINDSLAGDDLWVNANVGEAVPDVVTPYTWSAIRRLDEMATFAKGYYIWSGNICGRIYSNFGRRISAMVALGMPQERAKKSAGGEMYGKIPRGAGLPVYPYSKSQLLGEILPRVFSFAKKIQKAKKSFDEDVKNNPEICAALEKGIVQAESCGRLLEIWHKELVPYTARLWYVQGIGGSKMPVVTSVKNKLLKLMDQEDVNILLSNVHGSGSLASMGPLTGIGKIIEGQMTREEYLRKYGHRSPYELELSVPHPAENPEGLDKQINEYIRSSVNVDKILEKQTRQFQQALDRFQQKYPGRKNWLKKQLEKAAQAARIREETRSEFTRAFRLSRTFARKAAELTGIGNAIFFLYIDEVLELLRGDKGALAWIDVRRENYERYKALPSFPPVIRGRFDPFLWAKIENRRMDFYSAEAPVTEDEYTGLLEGFAGSAGTAEGIVRILETPGDGEVFLTGEILVTHTTNIGWTPLFPRAAAIVTDVGAPLSHAAIVARELGIPAVVGCGNATMRLKTGDKVLVNGGQGNVRILEQH